METDHDRKDYNAFLTNRGLSQHIDAVMYANEMNQFNHLDPDIQYEYLFRVVRKMKRPFQSWPKIPKSSDVELIADHYKVNLKRARQMHRMFPLTATLLKDER